MNINTVINRTPLSNSSSSYLLRDEFTDDRSVGALNGTPATDGATRTVIDTNSKLYTANGYLRTLSGGVGNGDPAIRWPGIARNRGVTVITCLQTTGASAAYAGWDVNTTGTLSFGALINTTSYAISRNSGVVLTVGTYVPNTPLYVATISRTTSTLILVKSPAPASNILNWTLLYVNPVTSGATLYPCVHNGGTTAVIQVPFVRVPNDLILFAPIASDSFDRANGALGTSNGAGTEETALTTPAWVDKVGTSAIATNMATFSALSGGIGITTLETNNRDVYAEVGVTRTAGSAGLCLRYTDANNYLAIYHNGTNVQAVDVVAGTPTTILNTVVTYSAAALLTAALTNNKLRVFYSAAAVGAEVTTSVTSGTLHGIYATDTGATLNNFAAWARGTFGEYNTLNKYI